MIGENGFGQIDKLDKSKIHDDYRINYLRNHILVIKEAIKVKTIKLTIVSKANYRNEKKCNSVVFALINNFMVYEIIDKTNAFFSKSGFTDNVIQYVENNKNIYLFSLQDINLK